MPRKGQLSETLCKLPAIEKTQIKPIVSSCKQSKTCNVTQNNLHLQRVHSHE